jgi:glycine betaine/proline transport system substrate-binding protein
MVLIACVLAACTPDDSESSGAPVDAAVADAERSIADDSAPVTVAPTVPASPPTADPRAETVVLGRANWSSGRVQAEILRQLMTELGYDVTPPSNFESSPDLAYQWIATGEIHLWANSWYPNHLRWWEGEIEAENLSIGRRLARIDPPMAPAGGLQGWLVTRSWAEANDVQTLDQINADPLLWQQLDRDGNGRGEFYGCPEEWTCDDITRAMMLFAGWDNLEQVRDDFEPMFDEFVQMAERGQPAIAYVWAPTSYVSRAAVGDTTMWLSILDDSVLDDSNPLQIDLGGVEEWCQRCEGVVGFKELGPDVCLHGPDGCQLGWNAASIEITANEDWLERNPQLHELLRHIRFSAVQLSDADRAAERLGGSEADVVEAAARWIDDNRATVDTWLAAAKPIDD